MTTYKDSLETERKGLARILPHIKAKASGGRYVVTDKGRLSRLLQMEAGDALMNLDDDSVVGVEIKTEEEYTSNLFLETWSNREWLTKGWLYTQGADWLIYQFLDKEGVFWCCELPKLKEWAFGKGSARGHLHEYREAGQNRCRQKNDSRGRIVPIDVLMSAKILFRRPLSPPLD